VDEANIVLMYELFSFVAREMRVPDCKVASLDEYKALSIVKKMRVMHTLAKYPYVMDKFTKHGGRHFTEAQMATLEGWRDAAKLMEGEGGAGQADVILVDRRGNVSWLHHNGAQALVPL